MLFLIISCSLVHVHLWLVLMLRLISSLSCDLGEVFLEHFLFWVIVLLESIVVLHYLDLVVEVVIQIVCVGIVVEWATHSWRNILAACHWYLILVVAGSCIVARHLPTLSSKVLRLLIYLLFTLINGDELVLDVFVIRHILIFELVDIVEDILHLWNILGFIPEQPFRIFEAFGFYVLDLFHRVLFDFSPDQFFFKKI